MKKYLILFLIVFSAFLFGGCGLLQRKEMPDVQAYPQYEGKIKAEIYEAPPAKPDPKAKYIFYLHGRTVEDMGREAVSPEFGPYAYDDILNTLADRGFVVISEVRPKDTDAPQYAKKIVYQIVDLLNKDVPPANITVVGASKGGVITHLISGLVANKNINYVLLAACGKDYLPQGVKPDLVGNVLSVYDYKDNKGAGTCKDFFAASKNLNKHKEIELQLGVGHGMVFQPMDEWVEPTVAWAGGNYE
jgi:hypothetical protein